MYSVDGVFALVQMFLFYRCRLGNKTESSRIEVRTWKDESNSSKETVAAPEDNTW